MSYFLKAIDTEFESLPPVIKEVMHGEICDFDQLSLNHDTATELKNTLSALLAIKANRAMGATREAMISFATEDAFLAGEIAMLTMILEEIPRKNLA